MRSAACLRTSVTSEESIIWYETPYLIWTNYGLEKQDLGDMSAFYLSQKCFRWPALKLLPIRNSFWG